MREVGTRAIGWTLWLLFGWVFCGGISIEAAEPSKEYQLKSVLLWRLGQFTDWPTNAFESPTSPLVIGIVGENPFGDALALAVKDETAHGRQILVQPIHQMSELKNCHILYINEPNPRALQQTLEVVGHRSILTVGDTEGFARVGGMVRFVTEHNKIKLRVNLGAVAAAHLTIDARVLRAAELVEGP